MSWAERREAKQRSQSESSEGALCWRMVSSYVLNVT